MILLDCGVVRRMGVRPALRGLHVNWRVCVWHSFCVNRWIAIRSPEGVPWQPSVKRSGTLGKMPIPRQVPRGRCSRHTRDVFAITEWGKFAE